MVFRYSPSRNAQGLSSGILSTTISDTLPPTQSVDDSYHTVLYYQLNVGEGAGYSSALHSGKVPLISLPAPLGDYYGREENYGRI